MDLVLDGQRDFSFQTDPTTLAAAIIEINDYLQAQGRALQAIVVNGEPVPPEELGQKVGQRSLDGVESLEIQSADMSDLVLETIEELREVLPELPVVCQTLAQVLRGDTPQDGFGQFNQLFDIWNIVSHRQDLIARTLGADFEQLTVNGRSAAVRSNQLADAQSAARAAMESSDLAALADLLAYDLASLAEEETELVDVLHGMTGRGGDEDAGA